MNKELAAIKKRERIKKHRMTKKKHDLLMKNHEKRAMKKEIEEIRVKIPVRPKMTRLQAEARTKDMEANVIFNSRTDIFKKAEEAKKKEEKENGNA